MNVLLYFQIDLITAITSLVKPVGLKVLVAENLLLKQQLLLLNRPRQRGPNLSGLRHFILGAICQFIPRRRITRVGSLLSQDHRIRRSAHLRRWTVPVSHVQSDHSRRRSAPAIRFDRAPLFDFRQWTANLRILQIDSIRTVPHVRYHRNPQLVILTRERRRMNILTPRGYSNLQPPRRPDKVGLCSTTPPSIDSTGAMSVRLKPAQHGVLPAIMVSICPWSRMRLK